MPFIPTRIHGFLDYGVGVLLVFAPWPLGFAAGGAETWVPVLLGLSAIAYSLFTDYELGAIRALSMTTHLGLDVGSGVILAGSPWIFGFADLVYLPHMTLGLFEIGAALTTRTVPYVEPRPHPARHSREARPIVGRGSSMHELSGRSFPVSAGLLFGLGLGGFFDGIVLHQILQWHHMLTDAGYPPNSVANLEINTLWDGLFHATTYVFVVLGLIVLWRASRRTHIRWSSKLLVGSLLMGFGIFNLVEGVIDHHLLGIHHVNETVPREQWIYWDLGFLAWGAAMLIGGWLVIGIGRRETRNRAARHLARP